MTGLQLLQTEPIKFWWSALSNLERDNGYIRVKIIDFVFVFSSF
jgi:hypothetical protein